MFGWLIACSLLLVACLLSRRPSSGSKLHHVDLQDSSGLTPAAQNPDSQSQAGQHQFQGVQVARGEHLDDLGSRGNARMGLQARRGAGSSGRIRGRSPQGAFQSLRAASLTRHGVLTTGKCPEQERIGLVPILRAGLGMVDGEFSTLPHLLLGQTRLMLQCTLIATLSLLPEDTSVLHIGLFREKVSLQPVEYYSKVSGSVC